MATLYFDRNIRTSSASVWVFGRAAGPTGGLAGSVVGSAATTPPASWPQTEQ